MLPIKKIICIMSIVICFAEVGQAQWKTLEPGLESGIFNASVKSAYGDSKISVIRFDTAFFKPQLLSSASFDSVNLTARQWCQRYSLSAAINAGMYAKDYYTHTGFMKDYEYVNSSRVIKSYKAILAFNPKDNALPCVQIIDMECQDFEDIKNGYNSMVQNIRMVDCRQNNVWQQQIHTSSIAALAMDKSGHVLFLFSQSPYSTHDFIDIILDLPLEVNNAMYLEGGSPASLCVMSGKTVIERCGIAAVADTDTAGSPFSLPMPNVIGMVRRNR
jgi:hypothetical protein